MNYFVPVTKLCFSSKCFNIYLHLGSTGIQKYFLAFQITHFANL